MVRVKNRYFVIKIVKENAKSETDSLEIESITLFNALMTAVQRLHGDFGVASIMSGFTSKYCNSKTRIAIIRCRHGPHKFLGSSIPFIRLIDQMPVHIVTLYVGATIRHCFKFIQRYQQKKYDEYCVGLKTDEEKELLRKEIMNLDTVSKFRL